PITDDARILPSAIQAGASALHVPVQSLDSFCFHHPGWYVTAAFNQVARSDRAALPSPRAFGIPNASTEACNAMVVARAHFSDPGKMLTETGKELVQDGLEAIKTGAGEV